MNKGHTYSERYERKYAEIVLWKDDSIGATQVNLGVLSRIDVRRGASEGTALL